MLTRRPNEPGAETDPAAAAPASRTGPTGGPGARIVPFGAVRPRVPTPTDDGALADILRRCADGDPGGVAALSAWQGGRIPRTYTRLVKDPELAEAGLAAVLGVLARDAGSYDPARGPAEDWVFGRLRRLALEPPAPAPAARPPSQPVRLRQSPPERALPQQEAASPEPPPAAEAKAPVPLRAPPVLEEAAPAPDVRTRRPPRLAPKVLAAVPDDGDEANRAVAEVPPHEDFARVPTTRRRPSALRTSREEQAADDAPASREERRRRPFRRLVFALLLLAAVGATAWAGLRYAGPEWNVRSVLPAALVDLVSDYFPSVLGQPPDRPAPPSADPTPDLPPPGRDPAASSGRAAIGGPADAPVTSRPSPTTTAPPVASPAAPPVVAPRQQAAAPSVAAPPPAARPEAGPGASASAGGGGIRVFIHHTAADRTGAALAAQLADQLRREGYPTVVTRQVRFRVTAPGVRYFFASDREAAGRLLRASTRFVAPRTGQAPSAPGDFTHVQPKPRAGTLEVWIPSR